jgi:hypothetical protein
MEELHTESIDGGYEASYGLGHVPGRGRTPTDVEFKTKCDIESRTHCLTLALNPTTQLDPHTATDGQNRPTELPVY